MSTGRTRSSLFCHSSPPFLTPHSFFYPETLPPIKIQTCVVFCSGSNFSSPQNSSPRKFKFPSLPTSITETNSTNMNFNPDIEDNDGGEEEFIDGYEMDFNFGKTIIKTN